MEKIRLASGSPRRHELLKNITENFEILPSNINEDIEFDSPEQYVQDLALMKALAVCQDHLTIGCDTTVVLENEVLGKPKDINEARATLLKLSGKTHRVLSGVAIVKNAKKVVFYDETIIHFAHIDKDDLERYLLTNDSLDKAGSYGIQSMACIFVKKIEGSYTNVVGLPMEKLNNELKSFLSSDL